jgi:hypothetical protein
MVSAACLLPLKHLKQLCLQTIEFTVPEAEDLQQLSTLTALTAVDLSYSTDIERLDESAGGWGALQLQRLSLWLKQGSHDHLATETMLQLSSLTGLKSLYLCRCGLAELPPWELANALIEMQYLSSLTMSEVFWKAPANAAANAASLTALLSQLADRWPRRRQPLTELTLDNMRVDKAAARALSKLHGLQRLKLVDCDLKDFSVSDIALHLVPRLQHLEVKYTPQLSDAWDRHMRTRAGNC